MIPIKSFGRYLVVLLLATLLIYKKDRLINYFRVLKNETSWKFYKILGETTGEKGFNYSKKQLFDGDQPMMIRENPFFPGQFFVAEKTGKIRVISKATHKEKIFFDMTGKLATGFYNGLYSFAFHPADSTLAVSYTLHSKDKKYKNKQVIELLSYNGKGVNYSSRKILYQFPLEDHLGGGLEFDDKGYLFISTGDTEEGDPYNFSQSLQSLAGKILRLKINKLSGEIPLDNPFSKTKFVKHEIWATGFRNPFRMSFLENGKTLLLGDVGHYKTEEVDLVEAGKNYGWNIKEGTQIFKDTTSKAKLTDPVFEYKHGVDGFSITGGLVYRGNKFPELKGMYIFGDFVTGRIWSLDVSKPGRKAKLLINNAGGITSFCETSDGELLWTDFSGNKIYKLYTVK